MIKVMDVYNELRETTDEVIRTLNIADVRYDPALVIGLSFQIMHLRALERYKISDAAQEALVKLIKKDANNYLNEKLASCPIVGCDLPMPHIHGGGIDDMGAKND